MRKPATGSKWEKEYFIEPMKKTQIHNQNNNKGFTMIEIIITIAIVAIGMIAVMGLIFTVTKGNLHSKRVTTASIIAQDNLEENLRKGYHGVADDSGTNTTYDIDYYWVTTVLADTP